MRKKYASSQGIVAGDSLDTVYQREIFFSVDPMTLDILSADEQRELNPSGNYLELEVEDYLHFLSDIEAEVFYLIFKIGKQQKDIAKLLGISQPTVSYRYRRVLTKLNYLMVLDKLPLERFLGQMDFLKDKEKGILKDLFRLLNQERVGEIHEVRQSTVRWVFTKSMRKVEKLESQDPEKWFGPLTILYFMSHYFQIRVAN